MRITESKLRSIVRKVINESPEQNSLLRNNPLNELKTQIYDLINNFDLSTSSQNFGNSQIEIWDGVASLTWHGAYLPRNFTMSVDGPDENNHILNVIMSDDEPEYEGSFEDGTLQQTAMFIYKSKPNYKY